MGFFADRLEFEKWTEKMVKDGRKKLNLFPVEIAMILNEVEHRVLADAAKEYRNHLIDKK